MFDGFFFMCHDKQVKKLNHFVNALFFFLLKENENIPKGSKWDVLKSLQGKE